MPLISVALVGVAQVIGIGTLYYTFLALSTAMAAEFDYPSPGFSDA